MTDSAEQICNDLLRIQKELIDVAKRYAPLQEELKNKDNPDGPKRKYHHTERAYNRADSTPEKPLDSALLELSDNIGGASRGLAMYVLQYTDKDTEASKKLIELFS